MIGCSMSSRSQSGVRSTAPPLLLRSTRDGKRGRVSQSISPDARSSMSTAFRENVRRWDWRRWDWRGRAGENASYSAIVSPSLTLEWFGCTTFRVRVAGLTLLFDTYLDRPPSIPDVGLTSSAVDSADFAFIS